MSLRGSVRSVNRTAWMLRVSRGRQSFYTRPRTFHPLQSSHALPEDLNRELLQPRFFSASRPRYDANTVVCVPAMAESITEGTLAQLSKQVGDLVEQDEELATIETDKIDVSVNAPHSGIIQQLLVAEGDTVTVDQAIAEIKPAEGSSEQQQEHKVAEKSKSDSDAAEAKNEPPSRPDMPSPASKPTSTEEHQVSTYFPYPAQSDKHKKDPDTKNGSSKPRRGEEKVKMTRIRQKTAQHLKQSQNTAVFLTTFNEIDMSQLIEFRKKQGPTVLAKYGVKLGYMGAMARASALALHEIPSVNAAIENGDTIVYRDYVDLSVAAAIPKGLVTPVLRNIESMSIVEIEKGIADLVAKARDGKLTMGDLMGGSFTISNSGIWGSLFGTPIINMPQTAVLGTYGIRERPVAIDGQVEIRPMMYIALTYDHRIIDGREAVQFLNLIKQSLEQPSSMLLH
ncbi:hypothetical protein N7532_004998 [Penicillium argentinense]|uniref:dihydrolipoyllysine-residue succinyltransferase n=1 Tax=Penicillium argentinense TaxID=1131581 RepID=A0A9W9KAI5_9EURO|nr:uncharacterized protein N7532_004998 [Penicillium argentinense]KAJ5097997.1 hypothetical protein N7532_004998 [Penicillium argentinense]